MNLMYIFGLVTAQLLLAIGFTGLYFNTKSQMKAMEKDLRKKSAQVENLSRRVWILEHRDADRSDTVYVSNGAKIGGF